MAEDVSDAPGEESALSPAERALIAAALPERRDQFAAGRGCARRAMELLGEEPRPVPADATGAPVWPSGLVGSITHCRGYRAAALARRADVTALGIDAEPNLGLRDGVLELVSSARERVRLTELAAALPQVHVDRLLFSAKEAAYKAWYPLHGIRLGFRDAELTLSGRVCDNGVGGSGDLAEGTFRVRLSGRSGAAREFRHEVLHGRWAVRDFLIMTAVARE
ncbi:4'-phosphopantetheinyl transferase family protein [Streptomyces sp. SYSU K21746]